MSQTPELREREIPRRGQIPEDARVRERAIATSARLHSAAVAVVPAAVPPDDRSRCGLERLDELGEPLLVVEADLQRAAR